jgi:hypothetical protein
MTINSLGQTKTQQLIDNHPDIFLQDFIKQSINNNPNTVNKNNINYFSNKLSMFDDFKKDVNKLLFEIIESYLNSVGFEKDKDYYYGGNYTIKTNPVVFVKVLAAYNYNAELAKMLKNVLVY